MNRTSTPSGNTSAHSSPKAAFNYAQAAKRSSQIQDQQQSQRQKPSAPSPSPSNPPVPSGNQQIKSTGSTQANGTSTPPSQPVEAATAKPAPAPQRLSFASALAKNIQPQAASAGQASPSTKSTASVKMFMEPPADAAPIQFGSINQPADADTQTSTSKSDDVAPVLKSEVTFGSLPATDTSDINSQPNNHGGRQYGGHRQHYNQNKHSGPTNVSHSPNMPNAQAPPYMGHHSKKPISAHVAANSSPTMTGAQAIPMNAWQHQNAGYYVAQGYDARPSAAYYPPSTYPMSMPAYGSMGIPQGANRQTPSPHFQQTRERKSIPIINPATMTEVKADTVSSISSPSSMNAKESPKQTDKKDKDFKVVVQERRPIPIVDPAIKDHMDRSRREKEEAEREAKLEAERKAKEEAERIERERLEAERKQKEEEERKERERIEAERKAKEEEERKERERLEAERKAKEEAERLERERLEAERKAKEEEELKAREEAERLEKERLEKERLERERQEQERQEQERKEQERKEQERKEQELKEQEALKAEKKAKEEQERATADAASRSEASAANAAEMPETPVPSPAKVPRGPMRTISDISTIKYPPEIKAPQAAKSGKIQYDPAFLLQFQPLCLETSEDLSAFQNIGDEQNDRGGRGMQRRQTSERGRGPRQPGSGMEGGLFKHGSRDGRLDMNKFGGRSISHRSGSGNHALPSPGGPGSPGGMQREGSQGGRSRSGRGGKGRHGGKDQERQEKQQVGGPTIPPEQVAPLEMSESRWVPLALRKQREAEKASEDELPSDELIIRKVKSLLNKLTMEKFQSISDQIWEYAKISEKEEDGRALRIVIQLTFEKACDEPAFASMWAMLCRKLYDNITDDTKDVNILDNNGNPVTGANLYRKYLLNRCQHDFERGWKTGLKKVDEMAPDLLSDEYYAAMKAKRQGLGLTQFIGEMFKRQMLTDRIMIACLMRLCDKPLEVEDEEVETLCKLLSTIGKDLDATSRRDKEWVDTCLERMQFMSDNNKNLSSRVKFMIMDVFDLRKNKWVPRRGNQVAPTTIAQIHEEAQKAKNEKEKEETMKRANSSRGSLPHPMSRTSSHRGAGREMQREGSKSGNASSAATDGWNTVGTAAQPVGKSSRVNDLSNFGKTDRSKTRSSILGPSGSPFASLNRAGSSPGLEKKSGSSESRAPPGSPMSNMFSALGNEAGQEANHEESPEAPHEITEEPAEIPTAPQDNEEAN